MSRSGGLYANERLLTKGCTSFFVIPSHLLFTTSQHLLKFVHLTDAEGILLKIPSLHIYFQANISFLFFYLPEMEVPNDIPASDERCRCIERGGRLVTVMPSTFGVILQMPRGNLETVYPRALVLAGIRSFIDVKDYRSAFLTCRSQMVDMNILHDYAPKQFMENVPLFIEQVKRVDFIDDFISRLQYVD